MRHGDYVAKIRVAPATENTTRVIHRELDLRGRPDVFYPTRQLETAARGGGSKQALPA